MPTRHRRTVRLPFHAYDGGLYFVIVCTWGRQPIFGAVVDGEMVRSAAGDIARDEWLRTAEVRASVVLDAFVVMPDHAHLLFGIVDAGGVAMDPRHTDVPVGATRRVAPTERNASLSASGPLPGSVGAIMGQYKSRVTKQIRQTDPTVRVWQRSFHDRVVRTDREADALRRYVHDNSARWAHRPDRADGHQI